MTRINCVPAHELTDKHLIAEYRELPRISALAWKWADRKESIDLIGSDLLDSIEYKTHLLPRTYILGQGHVKFFYDKGEYLRNRFENEIVPEMHKRGFQTQFTKYRAHPNGLNNNWKPTDTAMALNRARIAERLSNK